MALVYVLMNTEPSQMESVVEEVREIKGVVEAYMVYGTFDICAKVSAELPQDLKGALALQACHSPEFGQLVDQYCQD